MAMGRMLACACAAAALAGGAAIAAQSVKLFGYLEYRKGSTLIVDAQRITVTPKTKLRLSGGAKGGAESIPIGYELLVQGERAADGSVVAKSIEAKPNGL